MNANLQRLLVNDFVPNDNQRYSITGEPDLLYLEVDGSIDVVYTSLEAT
jgi:hypothetical protein